MNPTSADTGADTVRFRIVLVDAPPGVPWKLQLGRDTLRPPITVTREAVTLEGELTVGPVRPDGLPSLRGPAAQGPASARFLYANSGRHAGDVASPWDRRAKIPLATLTPAMIAECQRVPGSWLEARVAGTSRDGGPACATVPLLDGGWRVRRPGAA